MVKNFDDGTQAISYKTEAAAEFQSALTLYNKNFNDYKTTNQNSGTSTIQSLTQETYDTTKAIAGEWKA